MKYFVSGGSLPLTAVSILFSAAMVSISYLAGCNAENRSACVV